MVLTKQKFREIILQILYSQIFTVIDDDIISFMMNEIKTTRKNVLFAREYVKKILNKIEPIDEKIKKTSKSYDFERISKIELSILRLAIYELENDKLPFEITLSESLRLTKKFSGSHSINYIHAILKNIFIGKANAVEG